MALRCAATTCLLTGAAAGLSALLRLLCSALMALVRATAAAARPLCSATCLLTGVATLSLSVLVQCRRRDLLTWI
jgi:hypothetical protein